MRIRRVPGPPLAAIATELRKLQDAFDYPDAPRGIESGRELFGGEGGSAPDVVVAASDAPDFVKSKADFVAQGTDDVPVIRAAYDLVGPGRVLLTKGTFDIPIAGRSFACLVFGAGGTIQGMGPSATILNITDEPDFDDDPVILIDNLAAAAHTTIRDLAITGGTGTNRAGGVWAYGNNARILNCRFATTGHGVALAGNYQIIHGCVFLGARGIDLNGGAFLLVADNHIDTTGNGIDIPGASQVVLDGNYIFSDAQAIGALGGIGDPNGLVCVGNSISGGTDGIVISGEQAVISGNQIAAGTGRGIYLPDPGAPLLRGRRVVIADNYIHDGDGIGIECAGIDNGSLVIADNTLDLISQHGIQLTDCDGAQIHHNSFHQIGVGTFNTYDAIRVVTTDRARIDHNKILVPWLSGTGSTRYGVHIVSGSCNIVVGNDLGIPAYYGQDALGDFGTNTMLYYPAAGFYGDNFTDCPPGS